MDYLISFFRLHKNSDSETAFVIGTLLRWITALAVVGLVGTGVSARAAETPKPAPKPTEGGAASDKPAASKPAYSATRSQSRKTRLASARATASAREFATTILPRYKVDASGDLVPDLRAAAAIIFDPQTNEVLWEENSQSQRSIASITKVMTAVVFLESNPDPSQEVTILRSDMYQASTTKLWTNDRVTVDDLLHLLLIPSDNAAARALARISPHGSAGFVSRMNEKAAEMGLVSTHYADPSGLLSDNVSSAYDMARLIAYASADDRISSIMRTPEYTVHAAKRTFNFHSTNQLLGRGEYRRARRQDGLHLQGRLLSGHATAIAAGWTTGGCRRARRAVECRPLPRNAESLQLALEQSLEHPHDDHDATGLALDLAGQTSFGPHAHRSFGRFFPVTEPARDTGLELGCLWLPLDERPRS